jgi:hypothetical protein
VKEQDAGELQQFTEQLVRQRKARNLFDVDEHLAKAIVTPAGKASNRAAASSK